MKTSLLSPALSFFLIFASGAQVRINAQQQTAKQNTAQNAVTQSPELVEASQLSNRVVKLYSEGKFDEALPLAERALKIRAGALPQDYPLVASALINLAEIRLAKKDYEKAEPLFQKVLKMYEKLFGVDDNRNSRILDRLGIVFAGEGKYDKAETVLQRSLAIREKIFGLEHASILQSLIYLADLYEIRGEYVKAEPFFFRVLTIKEKNLSTPRSEVFDALDRYTCVLRKLNKRNEAEALEKRYNTPLFVEESPNENFQSLMDKVSKITQGGVLNGKAISLPKPIYPEEARAKRLSGTVIVKVVIDESGKVIRACALTGHLLLMRASEQSAYGARFTPTRLGDVPVKVTGTITYNFIPR